MGHFHYLEDEALHCRRWFCDWESRVESIEEVLSNCFKARDEKRREVQRETSKEETPLVSRFVSVAQQELFLTKVKIAEPTEVHRRALFELARFRWELYGDEEGMRQLPSLPQLFTYEDKWDNTVYFFNGDLISAPAGFNSLIYSEPRTLEETEDDGKLKLPLAKIAKTTASKLFD